MQTLDTRRKTFLTIEQNWRKLAAQATTEEDRKRYTDKADEANRSAHQKDQPKP